MKRILTCRVYVYMFALMLLLGSDIMAQFTITGTVTDPTSLPVSSVEMRMFDATGNALGIPLTLTDIAGFYSITGVPAGTYELEFRPPGGTNFMRHNITNIVVTGNTVVNAQLQIGIPLSGIVSDNSPIPQGILDVDLNVYDQFTGVKIFTPGDNTDITGFYSVLVPVGTYRIRYRSATGLALVPVEIENVVISTATTINITMESGFFVSGTVTGPLSQPVFDADLDFIDVTTGLVQFTPGDNTDISGFYDVVLPAGIYNVEVEPVVADRLVAGSALGVLINQNTNLLFSLTSGLSLSGNVTNSLSVPVANVDIDVKDPTTGVKLNTPSDFTDALGNYEIIVPSGVWDVIFQPVVATMLAPVEYSGVIVSADKILNAVVLDGIFLSGTITGPLGAAVVGVDIDAKHPTTGISFPLSGDATDSNGFFQTVLVPGTYHIEIEPPQILKLAAKRLLSQSLLSNTNINESLLQGFSVSGTVTDSGGAVVPNVTIDAIVSSTTDTAFIPGNFTDAFGFYEIIVAAGTYDLLYTPDPVSGITDSVIMAGVTVVSDNIINVQFNTPIAACCSGTTGNADGLGGDIPSVGDISRIVDNLFGSGSALICIEEADVDQSGGANPTTADISVSDISRIIDLLFGSGNPLPNCQ